MQESVRDSILSDSEGWVIAGGQSRRMGRDKAAALLAGKPLLAHMLAKLAALGLPARLGGLRGSVPGVHVDVVQDRQSGDDSPCGPLSGIETALRECRRPTVLVVPVDLPLVPVSFLRLLLDRAHRTGAVATIPRIAGTPQPVCAVYRHNLQRPIEQALDSGEHKVIRAVFAAAQSISDRVDLFDAESLAAAGSVDSSGDGDTLRAATRLPLHLQFMNCNTPEELRLAESLLASAPIL
jgi:molybdenum cofactor guanylyltransferase